MLKHLLKISWNKINRKPSYHLLDFLKSLLYISGILNERANNIKDTVFTVTDGVLEMDGHL